MGRYQVYEKDNRVYSTDDLQEARGYYSKCYGAPRLGGIWDTQKEGKYKWIV